MLDDLAWFPLAAPCMRRHYGPWRSPRGPYPRYRKTQYLGSALFLERPRARIERATSRHYMIYQQNAEVVNLQAFAGGVGATYRFSMFVAREHPLQRARPGAGVDGVVLGHTTLGSGCSSASTARPQGASAVAPRGRKRTRRIRCP